MYIFYIIIIIVLDNYINILYMYVTTCFILSIFNVLYY